ncbi:MULTISPECIES: NADase-type glycan-binding domain-containing protein [unclassified Streptomyces]|uniref:NADase-type glycan-binding domain-containing protein n=1 Tax=unclassified Streptomyces TaxID=2593676 RepID=UPI0033F1A67D
MTASQASGGRDTREPTLACAECGTRYEPEQSFCDGCGAVLPWPPARPPAPHPDRETASRSEGEPASGAAHGPWPQRATVGGEPAGSGPAGDASALRRSAAGVPGSPGPMTADHPAPPGSDWPDLARGRPGSADAEDRPGAGDPGADDHPTRPAPRAWATTGNGTAARDQERDQERAQERDRARDLLVPVADPQDEPERPPSVAPVLPGRPAPARPEVRTPGEPESHGGVACPWCRIANRPDRHFCARCAMPMAEGPENPARRPWWRRLLDHRNREVPWAGDRPRLRHQIGRILRWVALAAVLGLVAWALFQTPRAVTAVRDHFAKRAPLVPDSVKASRSYPEHGPDKAFDAVSNSWWGPGVPQSAEGEWLEARFRDPVRLLDIGITPGQSARGDTLTKSALPHRVEVRITTDDGKTTTRELNLDQGVGFQHRPFRAENVTVVRFTIRSAYGADAKKQVAIAEIEFFGPSNATR